MDSKLIAFIGPNEAGKTSVLQGLSTLNANAAFNSKHISRRATQSGERIVSATFVLDDQDIARLKEAGVVAQPGTREVLYKSADGKRTVSYHPPMTRDWDSLEALRKSYMEKAKEVAENENILTKKLADKLLEIARVFKSRSELSAEAVRRLALTDAEASNPEVKNKKLAPIIEEVLDEWRRSVSSRCTPVMTHLRPQFILYDANERSLETRYNLSDDDVVNFPAQPLSDILAIAGLDVAELSEAFASEDLGKIKTLLKAGNRRLSTSIAPAWQQSKLTLRLENEGAELLILIDELTEDGAITTLDERSDGLRAFLAMFCFVIASARKRPAGATPLILLLDEADRHLHYDAQADLVNVLMGQSEVKQVLYSTHSPGCLPPDLGTSVRLVEPDPEFPDVSHLKNNFWSSEAIGFNPLLVAMGAGAAAFSTCRRAVLAEGATEMVLLPTLMRLATGLDSLQYQVAPGLSGLKKNGLGIDEVAAKVAYMLDGDAGGNAIKRLLEATGVPEHLIVTLPRNKAIEDLIDRDCYLQALEAVREENNSGAVPLNVLVKTGATLGKQIEDAAKEAGVKVPGKIAVANYLVQNPEKIVLSEANRKTLQALHESFCSILKV